MTLFVEVLERELDNLERMDVRVRVIGDSTGCPTATADAFERCVAAHRRQSMASRSWSRSTTVARADIVAAAERLAEEVAAGELAPERHRRGRSSRSSLSTAGHSRPRPRHPHER